MEISSPSPGQKGLHEGSSARARQVKALHFRQTPEKRREQKIYRSDPYIWNGRAKGTHRPSIRANGFQATHAQARQRNPARVDQVFKREVAKTTAKQLNALLAAMRVKRKDPAVFQKAFLTLAMALLGVGQVVWTPPHSRKRTWTREDEATLFWLVHDLMDRDTLSARSAVGKIAPDESLGSFFPYQAKQLPRSARLSASDRRFGALWQAWNKVNRRRNEIISNGRPIPFHGIFGGKLGRWEARLIGLDTQNARTKPGKKRPQ